MLHARGRTGVDWTAVDRAVREKSRAGSPEDFESCEGLVVPASAGTHTTNASTRQPSVSRGANGGLASAGVPQRHAASASSVANLSDFEADSDLSDFEDY